MLVVETEGLTKYYGRTRGIESLNLSIEKGEITLASFIVFSRKDIAT